MTSPRFSGVYTALVTPFHDDGSLDLDAYRQLVDEQIEAGVHGLVPCGTTGEAATMSPEEQLQVIKACKEQAKGRVPIVAGAGNNATARAVDMHQAVKELGVDGALHVTPWYNKPTQEGLYQHFKAVSESASLPIVLYNVPGRTGVDLLASTVERLARDIPDVVAVKEATASPARSADILARLADERPDFSVLSGDDGHILSLLGQGGHGVISVISHLCAEDLRAMFDAWHEGDVKEAQRLSRKVSPLQPALFFTANPIPVKTALALQGKMKESFRLPLCPLDDDGRAELRQRLADAGYPLVSR
jgi:4-hydroxy-tetrahydrodipicolinate synthase